jgi:hypothetical protein
VKAPQVSKTVKTPQVSKTVKTPQVSKTVKTPQVSKTVKTPQVSTTQRPTRLAGMLPEVLVVSQLGVMLHKVHHRRVALLETQLRELAILDRAHPPKSEQN